MQKDNKKMYVSMTDKMMSNWGRSEGKTNKLIFICKDYNEAEIVKNNAESRGDQSYINICTRKPYYNNKYNLVQYITKQIYPKWYIKNAF